MESNKPQSEPERPEDRVQQRKLADAMAGNYDFSIAGVMDEAWARTKGFKQTFCGAALLWALIVAAGFLVIYFIGFIVGSLLGGSLNSVKDLDLSNPILQVMLVLSILALPFMLSLMAGIWMIGINRAADNPSHAKMLFNYFHSKKDLLLSYSWVWLLTAIAEVFIRVLPNTVNVQHSQMGFFVGGFSWLFGMVLYLYVMISYFFYIPLVVEKKLSPWQALETSRHSVGHRYFKVAATLLILLTVLCVPLILISALALHYRAFLALGIIYVWLLPFAFLVSSILYREIFGVAKTVE